MIDTSDIVNGYIKEPEKAGNQ